MTYEKVLVRFHPEKEYLVAAIKEIVRVDGFFSVEAAKEVADYFGLSIAQVFSAASFYDEVLTRPRPNLVIKVCDGTNCLSRGGQWILDEVEAFFGQREGDDFSSKIKIEKTSCLGHCLQGPIMTVNGVVFEKLSPGMVDEILRNYVGK